MFHRGKSETELKIKNEKLKIKNEKGKAETEEAEKAARSGMRVTGAPSPGPKGPPSPVKGEG